MYVSPHSGIYPFSTCHSKIRRRKNPYMRSFDWPIILCLEIFDARPNIYATGNSSAYWVSFGPHGPREPLHAPGSGIKLLLGITGCVSAAIALFVLIRSACKSDRLCSLSRNKKSPTDRSSNNWLTASIVFLDRIQYSPWPPENYD
jgi:hypothetical protein